MGDTRCDVLTAIGLTSLADAVRATADDTESQSAADAEKGKQRREEDSLSSALMLSARMEDLHAQRRALRGWAAFYESIGNRDQAREFSHLHADFDQKLKRQIEESGSKRRNVTRKLAESAGKARA